jgi:hypothetical protein
MKRFVEGADRGQGALFPECLDDWIPTTTLWHIDAGERGPSTPSKI